MAKEEIIFKLSMLEEQAGELKQQIDSLDSQISELQDLGQSLEKVRPNKEKEMLAPLGRGIFLKTEIKDDKVLVNVGSKILVKKTFPEAVEIINVQIKEMEKIKIHLISKIEEINSELSNLVNEAKLE